MAPAGQIVKDFTLARINLTPGAHATVQRMRQGTTLLLIRDKNDRFDTNAIMVVHPAPGRKTKIGYLPLGLAKELAPLMDAGVNVIARKAPNPLYGVCQVAWIPPGTPEPATPTQPKASQIDLPEGVTLADLETATDLPPLGDSKRPSTIERPPTVKYEVPDAEQSPESPDEGASERD